MSGQQVESLFRMIHYMKEDGGGMNPELFKVSFQFQSFYKITTKFVLVLEVLPWLRQMEEAHKFCGNFVSSHWGQWKQHLTQ